MINEEHNQRWFTNFNQRTNTLLYKNISLTFYSQKGWCFCDVWEMGGETYTKREDFFFPYLLPGARRCQRLHPLASSSLIGCMSLARLWFSALCPNLTTWFSSRDPLPVTYLFNPSALIVLSSSCFLIKMWQLAKAHKVTRNKPKIHVI